MGSNDLRNARNNLVIEWEYEEEGGCPGMETVTYLYPLKRAKET